MFNKKLISLVLVFNIIIISTIFPVFSVSDNLTMESETIESFEKFEDDLFAKNPDAYILANKEQASVDKDFRTDRVIVVLKHEYSKVNREYSSSDFNDSIFSEVEDLSYIENYSTEDEAISTKVNIDEFHQILSLKLKNPGKENVIRAIAYLNTLDNILSAEPDYIYKHIEDFVPNDPKYSEQWGLKKVNLESAWNITKGSATVKVGIFESGLSTHADISQNRIVMGNLQYDQSSVHNHGTWVTGIIGATSDNNTGVAGVAQVKLVILDKSYNNFVSSLSYAANNDIYIINASFHYENEDGTMTSYNSAHAAAIQNYPGLIVCAAGNRNANIDISPQYPAAYDLGNIITVANTDENDNLYIDMDGDENDYSSNYGANKVHLAAPGTRILTTSSAGGYITKTGTSLSAPFVTGVAALLKSKYPAMTTRTLRYYILNKGVDVKTSLQGKVSTSGRLNAYKALSSVTTYTIQYNSNGGSGNMSNTKVIYNNFTPLRKNTFTKSGYTFIGWYAKRSSDNKCYYTNGTSGAWCTEGSQPPTYRKYLYTDEQTVYNSTPYNNDIVTLTAQWAPNYTIRFNGNDADSGTMADMSVTTATPFYLTQNAFSRGTDDMTHWYAKKGNLMYYTGANGAGWYTHGNQPSGYVRKEFTDGMYIIESSLSGISSGDIITMNAYWEPQTGILGDADTDGRITIKDSTLIQNFLANQATLTAYQQKRADVNFSGTVTIKDSTMIQKYVGNEITEFGS